MILQTKEAVVLEGLRRGLNQKEICIESNFTRANVSNIVSRLSELSAIRIIERARYEILLNDYQVKDDVNGSRIEKMVVDIPDAVGVEIIKWYGKIPRSELARRIKSDKFTLNMMILQLGMGGL